VAAAVSLVRVVRSGLEESVHLGHVAVCDAGGRLVAWAGDPTRTVFARSSLKPVQTAVSLKAIDEPLPDAEVAVMCASHNGEPVHVGVVRRVLLRAGLSPAALLCPPARPLDPEAAGRVAHPHRELHDCSGKHAGMLLACVRAGYDVATYVRPKHPLQKRIHRAVLRVSGLEEVVVGADGCGVPVFGMPLASLATVFARLSRPESLGELGEQVDRCVEAMLAEPYLVGGRETTDTAVMSATGDVVSKVGAEGLECAAVLSSGLGIAVKVADGGDRASGPALIRALESIGALAEDHLQELARFARPAVTGGGRSVGELRADFDLRGRPSSLT